MKNVLLLGDSIREHYQSNVVKNFQGKYAVYFPWENCRFSAFTLNSLRYWLDLVPNPDIIHWNNGLWDCAHINGENRCFCSLDEYISNMDRIYNCLKERTNAKIILATITPTKKGKENNMTSSHFVSDIKDYNDALINHFKDKVDAVDDLYSLVEPNIEKIIKDDDMIHLTEYGKEICANQVCQIIEEVDKRR